MKRYFFLLSVLLLLLLATQLSQAQNELAAMLKVVEAGVEVQRVNTTNWIPVTVEAIVGVGDTIRTNTNGRARIIFFADEIETEIQPDTLYRIQQFQGDDTSFKIEAEVLAGNTLQTLARLLNADSSYHVKTPAMQLAARGTLFAIRVESDGRSAMLVSQGRVAAAANDNKANESQADVDAGFGVRAKETLSEVVAATTFAELDAALDGCEATITTQDDVSLNVRQGASLESARIGVIAANEITRLVGTVESGDWYRVEFRGGFGWILSTTAEVVENCAGLRRFPVNHGPENALLYSSLGDLITIQELITPQPETTPEPTSTP